MTLRENNHDEDIINLHIFDPQKHIGFFGLIGSSQV